MPGTSTEVARNAAPRRIGRWLIAGVAVTFLAGLLFGYDQGVISGALPLLSADLGLSTLQSEIVTSWVTLGALFGALVAGGLADRAGRKRTAVLAGVLFALGALVQATSPGAGVLTAGRVIAGFGVGVASVVAPLYAAEIAPGRLRGRFVSVYQLAITVGIFLAYLADRVLANGGNWRVMLGLSIVPGIALAIAFLGMPDTPRWLLSKDRRVDARSALTKFDGADQADESLAALETTLAAESAEERATWREVFDRSLRAPLIVGLGLAVLQQVTGINAIIYYANSIFADAGFTTPEQQANATLVAIGAVNVIATLIAIKWIDQLGRRPLLTAGLVGMALSLATVSAAFAAGTDAEGGGISVTGIITVIALVVFIASFAFSLGPVTWTVISEIYPNRVRGQAVAVATAVNWFSAFLVTQFFLSIVDAIGQATTFLCFALICVVGLVFVRRFVPETAGRTLEEIQAEWRRRA